MLIHTNHYLAQESLNTLEAFPSSRERYEQAIELSQNGVDRAMVERLLSDQSRGELSICRAYSPSLAPGFGRVGTVATIIMDLGERQMALRRGPRPDGEYRYYSLA